MTQPTGTAHARWLGSMAAAALAFAGTSIALASDSTPPKGDVHETVIVKVISHDDHAMKNHEGDEHGMMKRCGTSKPQVDASDETKDDVGKVQRSRVIICNRGGHSDAEMLASLEKARTRLAEVTELSDAAKAKALASLDREIARLRPQSGYSKQ